MRKLSLLALLSLGMATASPMVNSGKSTQVYMGLKLPCIYSTANLGHVELYRDEEGFKVLHNGELREIHNAFVDKTVRNMDQDQLTRFLGLNQPQVTLITKEEAEESPLFDGFEAYEVSPADLEVLMDNFGSGYLRIDQMSDGEFSIKAFSRGLGGGPIVGTIVGCTVKAAGYTTIAILGGPIGWATVGVGLGSSVLSGCVSGLFKVFSGGDKVAQGLKKAAKATKAANKAKDALNVAKIAATKAPTARNIQKVAKLTKAADKLGKIATSCNAKYAAKGIAKGTEVLVVAKDGVEVAATTKDTVDAVKAGKAVAKATKAAFMPTVGLVDGVADVCQFICDFLPTP